MYTILVTQEHKLIPTHKERIMAQSENVSALCFLVSEKINGISMADCDVKMTYILPISKEDCSEQLVLSDELYNGMLIYTFPIDSKFTKEIGDVEVGLTFTKDYLDESGNQKKYVRETSSTIVPIIPKPFTEEVPAPEGDEVWKPISEEKIASLFK